jgi:hypothetical protein
MPLGWRRAGASSDRVSYSNGLTGGFRSSATILQAAACQGNACACDRVVRALLEDDLWRLADVGQLKELHLGEVSALHGRSRVDGILAGEERQVQVSAVCEQRDAAPVAVVVVQPLRGSASLAERMAGTLSWPGKK